MSKNILITQAFSLTMLARTCNHLKVLAVSEDDAREYVEFADLEFAIKDKQLAEYLSDKLERLIPAKRRFVNISTGNLLVVKYANRVGDLSEDNPLEYYIVEIK